MKCKSIPLFVVIVASVATANVSAQHYEPYNCHFMEQPPRIDGTIGDLEWAPTQSIRLDYWVTYKGGYTAGAIPWDTRPKNAGMSIMSNSSHLFICLEVPDDFLSLEYPRRVLQIYLDDHSSDYIDRRGMLVQAECCNGKPYPNIDYVMDGIAYRNGTDGKNDIQLGGTMDTKVNYSHTGYGLPGKDGSYVFEFGLPLRVASHDVYDARAVDLDIELTYGEWSQNLEQTEYWRAYFRIELPEVVLFDGASVSQERCDVGSTQTIRIHGTWVGNGSDASGTLVKINDDYHRANSTGWVNIEDSSNTVLMKCWNITEVPECDNYKILFTNPSIVWDRVNVTFQNIRTNVGNKMLAWDGHYEFDGEPFVGNVFLNDTLDKNEVGKYGYRCMAILDDRYNLAACVANDFWIINDKVLVDLSIPRARVDITENPEIVIDGKYAYDSQKFKGSVKLSPTPVVKNPTKLNYTVLGIVDPLYRLTSFESNTVDCVFDRVKITQGGVSNPLTSTGNTETVWFKAVYEYDSSEFTGELIGDRRMNKMFVNDAPLIWSSTDKVWKYTTKLDDSGKLTFRVTDIEDIQYKLTTYIDAAGAQSITWEKPFFETPLGMLSIAAALVIVGVGVIFLIRRRA